MSTGPTRQDLLDLVNKLRHAVPSHAPMEVAERVQHCIVRLEMLAATVPIPDDAQQAAQAGHALVKTCELLFVKA